MKTNHPIAPTGFSFEDSISVEQADPGYGAPRSFTLADSFYDAHANDVFLQRKEHPVSVEPVQRDIQDKEPAIWDDSDRDLGPELFPSESESETAEEFKDSAALWPDQTNDSIPPPRFYAPPKTEVETSGEHLPTVSEEYQRQLRMHMSPEARMEDSFRIPVIATIVFVITMFAIFYLGSQVAGYYAPVVQGNDVEFVGRPSKTL